MQNLVLINLKCTVLHSAHCSSFNNKFGWKWGTRLLEKWNELHMVFLIKFIWCNSKDGIKAYARPFEVWKKKKMKFMKFYFIRCSKSTGQKYCPPSWPTSPARFLTEETEFRTNRADGEGIRVAKRHKVRILCLHAYIHYPPSIR